MIAHTAKSIRRVECRCGSFATRVPRLSTFTVQLDMWVDSRGSPLCVTWPLMMAS